MAVLAGDGTTVFETNTGPDKPVGPPVVYDWYDTGQNVLLLPAGDKIYGWNGKGEPLPRFPFQLQESVSSPLLISDINGDGRPEAFVATADRRLHALNGRGQNLEGWPVSTNSRITGRPSVGEYRNEKTIFAFSGNSAHGWRADGTSPAGFPAFIDAPFRGSPVLFDDHILGNAADGKLYAVGEKPMFSGAPEETAGSSPEAIYVSGSELTGSPQVEQMRAFSDGKTYEEPMIVTTDANGSLFVFTAGGKLLYNQNMGQPGAPGFSPLVRDINRNAIPDILTLGSYGRLYVWQSTDGKRLDIVPSASMSHPAVADIDEDGYAELIAKTDEGVQCWTIYGR